MKTIRILALAAALAAVPAFASDFGHEQALTIDGKPAHLAETSARILANETLTAPQLVEDITDGFGSKKIPGYKLMIMGRTYSVAAETKPPKEGQTQWRDNTFIHRGVKLFVGIPVKNGKMDLAAARLINIGVVDDNGLIIIINGIHVDTDTFERIERKNLILIFHRKHNIIDYFR